MSTEHPIHPAPDRTLDTTAPPQDRRAGRTGAYLLLVLTAGAYLPSALYPGYQQAFGFSDLTMTLVYATFALFSALALVLFGPAADALGTRPVLGSAVVVAAAGSLCLALATSTEWLLAGRALQGIALGAATGAATALIVRSHPAHRRLHGSMVAGMAFVAGTAAGPAVAGVLAQYAPAPTVLAYVLHLVLLAEGLRRLRALPSAPGRSQRWRPTRPRVPAHLRASFAAAAWTGFWAWTAAGLFLALIPALWERAAGVQNLAASGALAGSVLALSLCSQPLVPRLGAFRSQRAGLLLVALSLGILATTGATSTAATVAAALTAGTGHGLAYNGASTSVESAVGEHQRGEVGSALYIAFYLGGGGPAVAVGLLSLHLELSSAVAGLSAVAGAGALLTLVFLRPAPVLPRRRTGPASSEPHEPTSGPGPSLGAHAPRGRLRATGAATPLGTAPQECPFGVQAPTRSAGSTGRDDETLPVGSAPNTPGAGRRRAPAPRPSSKPQIKP